MNQDSCEICQPTCPQPFERVVISYLIKGGTRVYWSVQSTFTDPLPYVFQLQVGQSHNQNADDWTDVGLPVTNTYTAVDGEQRMFGKIRWLYYRVVMTTPNGVYYSEPAGIEGTLSLRDWKFARELLRRETVRMRQFAGQIGYLLKRRVTGELCPVCIDPLTNECRDPYCPTCYGTGFYCGYFFPIDCVWADFDPKTYSVKQTADRGTVADIVVKARMINSWMMTQGDIWVNKVTDDRYYIHTVQHTSELRGVPITANVEMRPAPASDPVYLLTIPDQLEEPSRMARRADR